MPGENVGAIRRLLAPSDGFVSLKGMPGRSYRGEPRRSCGDFERARPLKMIASS